MAGTRTQVLSLTANMPCQLTPATVMDVFEFQTLIEVIREVIS
jgi:hypothetical protein